MVSRFQQHVGIQSKNIPPGVLRNASGVLHNTSGVLRNASGVFHNASGVLRPAPGVCRTSSGAGRKASGVFRNTAGVVHSASGRFVRAAGGWRNTFWVQAVIPEPSEVPLPATHKNSFNWSLICCS